MIKRLVLRSLPVDKMIAVGMHKAALAYLAPKTTDPTVRVMLQETWWLAAGAFLEMRLTRSGWALKARFIKGSVFERPRGLVQRLLARRVRAFNKTLTHHTYTWDNVVECMDRFEGIAMCGATTVVEMNTRSAYDGETAETVLRLFRDMGDSIERQKAWRAKHPRS